MIRDMDVPAPNALDGRRLEVVVDGLPVRRGVQVRCTAMARHDGERTRMMEWLSQAALTLNSLAMVDGRHLWSLLSKLAVVGPRRLESL